MSATNGRQTSVVKSIPVDSVYGGIKYWEDTTSAYTLIQEDIISFFHIRLLGEDLSTLINFNGQAWNLTLSILFEENPNAP
eukprot:46523-Eustigmatos_ZCMA.PRE.1